MAISNLTSANDNLRRFKDSDQKYDILVSVAMAHVGYDCKEICVVCYLGSVRDENWLRQLFARGMRTLTHPMVPLPDDQFVQVIVPDDPKMVETIERLRRESEEGLQLRDDDTTSTEKGNGKPRQMRLGHVDESGITRVRAKGLDPENDTGYEEFENLDGSRRKHGLGAVPITGLKGFLRDFQGQSSPSSQTNISPLRTSKRPVQRTDKEEREALRSKISGTQNSINYVMFTSKKISEKESKFWAQAQTKKIWGGRSSAETVLDLQQVLEWVNSVLANKAEKASGLDVTRHHLI